MVRGKMYPCCKQCNKLFNENGYWDDSITLSQIEAFPYCSDCIRKNGWKKCSSCDKQGDFGDKASCSSCHYKQQKTQTSQEAQKDYEEKKKKLEAELNNLTQQRINEAFACKGDCGKIIDLKEEAYTYEGKGYYCKNCITSKIGQAYDEKNPPKSAKVTQIICSVCNNSITGDYYHLGDQPLCATCQPRAKLNLQTMAQILAGTPVDIDTLNLPPKDKTNLKAGQKIVKGEPVEIDSLAIDEDDKQFLRELQQKNPPKNNSSNYSVNCQNCAKTYQTTTIPPRCQHCQSRNIKVYDKAGFLQILPLDNQKINNPTKKKEEDNVPPYVIIPIILLSMVGGFFFYRWWWKKRKNQSSKD